MSSFQYTPPKNTCVSSEDLLKDLLVVARNLGTQKLTQDLYSNNGGKYNVSTIIRRFGTWNKALFKVGLKPGNTINYSEEELFENILNIWQHKGKQPVRRDLGLELSRISQGPYNRRFKSWAEALRRFIEYANESDSTVITSDTSKNIARRTGRDPSLRLRFRVLKRDNFTCVKCGATPAKSLNIELHVDHIKPWSKGGETEISNLQTLCQNCNLGKSNLE
jgi:ribosomal protein L31E